MRNDLNNDMVKLVEYNIVSIQRKVERLIDSGEIIVTDYMTSEAFASWRIATYLQTPGHEKISHTAVKYLRVHYRVLKSWHRQELEFEEKQLEALRRISRNISRSDTSVELENVAEPLSESETTVIVEVTESAETAVSEETEESAEISEDSISEGIADVVTESPPDSEAPGIAEGTESVEASVDEQTDETGETRDESISQEIEETAETREESKDEETAEVVTEVPTEPPQLSELERKIIAEFNRRKVNRWAKELAESINEEEETVRESLENLIERGLVTQRSSYFGLAEW